jgi:hypothetical protein
VGGSTRIIIGPALSPERAKELIVDQEDGGRDAVVNVILSLIMQCVMHLASVVVLHWSRIPL